MPPPMTLAAMLERRFGALSEAALQLALEILSPAVASGDQAEVALALEQIERRLADRIRESDMEAAAREVAGRVDRHHSRAFYAALGAAIGAVIMSAADGGGLPPSAGGIAGGAGGVGAGGSVTTRRRRKLVLVAKLHAEPRLIADEFARRNAKLIKSLRDEVVPALRDEVVRAVEFGITPDEAAARLEAKWRRKGVPVARGNMKPRLRMITRDQISKLQSQLARARMQASGVDRFRWRSQRDDRVRPLHREIDGEIYDWTNGHPSEGLPGDPPLCRCFAEAVVERNRVLQAPGLILLAGAEQELDLPWEEAA